MRYYSLLCLVSVVLCAEGGPVPTATEIEATFRKTVQSLGYTVGPTTESVIQRESKKLAETAAMMEGVTEFPTMVNGKKDGLFYALYKNGQLQRAGYFNQDAMVGPWVAYYDNGIVRWVGDHNASGQKVGQHRTYFQNGNMEHIECFKDDIIIGAKTTFYESGEPYIHQQWMDGKMNGLSTIYWKNGSVKKYSTWLNGRLNGKTITFDENGKTTETIFYENGVKKAD